MPLRPLAFFLFVVAALVPLGLALSAAGSAPTAQPFGKTSDGVPVERYVLTNSHGMEVDVITWGAIVQRIVVADKAGRPGDVALGFDTLDGYLKQHPYFGAIVGRYGNRIANATFTLGGKKYQLAANNGPNSLHGGLRGFDKRVWTAKPLATPAGQAVELTYVSQAGEEGYPGTLTTTVTYTVTEQDELRIDYRLSSDAETVANVTNHTYFNLAGQGTANILTHEVRIHADRFTPVNATLIPTGELRPVQDTPFDFRASTAIGARIDAKDEQIAYGKGYDHNWVLDGHAGTLRAAVQVTEATSGRVLDVSTTEPGVQFYTGNFLDGTVIGKGGAVYRTRFGFCLETQHFPDSPNQPSFPSTVVAPGRPYASTTVYRFTTKK